MGFLDHRPAWREDSSRGYRWCAHSLKVIPEHFLDQLHAVIHTAGMAGKRGEQLELGSRQIDFLALDQDLVARDIDDQIAEVEYLDGGLVG